MSIQYVSSLGTFAGDPRVFVSEPDVYRAWPSAPPSVTRYLSLGALFRRRQYTEGPCVVAGSCDAEGRGYALAVDDDRVYFTFGLRAIASGVIVPVVVEFALPKPRLWKWMCVFVSVVHQDTDTTIYLQVNGETVAVEQVPYAAGAMVFEPAPAGTRFCIAGGGADGSEFSTPFQLDVAGVGISLVGAPSLDGMSAWYDAVRQAGALVSPAMLSGGLAFQSRWRALALAASSPFELSAPWFDSELAGIALSYSGNTDGYVEIDTAPVQL